MKTNIVIDISLSILYLAKFWCSSYGPKCCQPIKLPHSLKWNILKKKWIMKCIFGMHINIEVFYRLIKTIIYGVCNQAQSTQNNKFPYLCDISRKAWRMNLIFCLKINANVFHKMIVSLGVCVSRHAQSTQNSKFAIFLQYLQKEVSDEVDLCIQISMKA